MKTNEYSRFFRSLEANNNKEWFHANKKTYEAAKRSYLELLDLLLPEMLKLDPDIAPFAKDAMFRINRDIRFSNDKTPYSTLLKSSFGPTGKKSTHPAYYLAIDANFVNIGGGLYMIKSPELKNYEHLLLKTLKNLRI